MSNPLYGQNKADNSLDNISAQWKVVKYDVTVDDTGIADGSAVVTDGIPAYFQPMLCIVRNKNSDSGDDMAANAVVLEVETSDQKLTTTLSGLAAGAQIACVCDVSDLVGDAAWATYSTSKDIFAEAADFAAASGKSVTFEISVAGWDLSTLGSALSGEN